MQSKTHGSGARSSAQQRVGFWSANLRTGAVTWDPVTAAIHGMPEGHAPTLHEALGFFGSADRARVVESALAALDSHTLFDIEAQLQTGSGARVRLIGGRGYEARNDGAELHGIIESLSPLSSSRRESAANLSMPFSAAVLMHELQAFITSIAMFSTLIARETDDPTRERVARISNAAAQMQRIFDAVTKIHSDEPPQRGRIDASAIAASAAQAHVERHPNLARAEVSIQPGIELDGEAAEVKLLLGNLLGNALKFSAQHAHPQVRVTATTQHGRTVVHVRDNGVGFEPGNSALLFKMFTRSCGPAFAGTGIGLAIVKRIVERHGGLVWAEGAPGEGATFSFYL